MNLRMKVVSTRSSDSLCNNELQTSISAGINVGLFWQHVLELCIIILYFLVQKDYTQQIIF